MAAASDEEEGRYPSAVWDVPPIAWVTGAGSGIGEATAMELSRLGAVVILSGRGQQTLERCRDAIIGSGGEADVLPLDVSVKGQVTTAVDRIISKHRCIDIVVNSAGTNVKERELKVLDPANWDAVVATNLSGVVYSTLAVLPTMRTRERGYIITIGSWVGRHPLAGLGASYAASKRALGAFHEQLRAEESKFGIRACLIHPGLVDTPILDQRPTPPTPFQRRKLLKPYDVACVVGFVATLPSRVNCDEIVMTPLEDSPLARSTT